MFTTVNTIGITEDRIQERPKYKILDKVQVNLGDDNNKYKVPLRGNFSGTIVGISARIRYVKRNNKNELSAIFTYTISLDNNLTNEYAEKLTFEEMEISSVEK